MPKADIGVHVVSLFRPNLLYTLTAHELCCQSTSTNQRCKTIHIYHTDFHSQTSFHLLLLEISENLLSLRTRSIDITNCERLLALILHSSQEMYPGVKR
jgi:hypothetical protein